MSATTRQTDAMLTKAHARIAELKAKIEAARIALHPPRSIEKMHDGRSVNVDHDPVYDLEGAIIDLERAGADRVSVETVKRIQSRVSDVLKILSN